MSLGSMIGRLRGEIPGISSAQAKNYINEALGLIYDSQNWSFQLKSGGWISPGLVAGVGYAQSAGTITVNTYDTTITGDATASAAWLALSGRPLITELQIRVPYYALYDVVGLDDTDPNAVILTIDRPWMEPTQTNGAYMLYQAYFPVPVENGDEFKRFYSIRDTTNAIPVDFIKLTQAYLAVRDPQRTIFNIPSAAVAFDTDTRPDSATPGAMRYELWPQPLSKLPYALYYQVRGPLLSKRDDTVPYPLTDEMVQWRAIEIGCLFKARQVGEDAARGSGADWKFSAQAAREEYNAIFKKISQKDRAQCELYFSRIPPARPQAPFASIGNLLNVGTME